MMTPDDSARPRPNRRGVRILQPGGTIQIDGRRYQVVKRLSLQDRGRWLVRDPQPKPRGTLCTAIVLPQTPEAKQLERSLRTLRRDIQGLPHMIAVGWHEGQRVWIISWHPGPTLENYFDRACSQKIRRPSVWMVVGKMRSLVHAVNVLHTHCQVVHGDIKPTNLILANRPGCIWLIDYGSSWHWLRNDQRLIGDGHHAAYTAPELLGPEGLGDFRSDQFSLGVVLYEMLTLQLPYAGLGGRAGQPENRSSAESAFVPPSRYIPKDRGIPQRILRQLDEVVGTALRLDPNRRFGTTRDFGTALDSRWHSLNQAQDAVAKSQFGATLETDSASLALPSRWLHWLRKAAGGAE